MSAPADTVQSGGRRLTAYVMPAFAGALALVVVLTDFGELTIVDLVGFALVLGTSLLGVVINNHQAGNRIAILLQLTAVLLLISALGDSREVDGVSDPTIWDYLSLVSPSLGILGIGALFLILYIFPDGTFISRRWRWLGRGFMVGLTLFAFSAAFSEQLGDPYRDEPVLANPIGFIPWDTFVTIAAIAAPLMMAMAIAGLVAISLRFRRSGPVVRAQIKWVLYAAVVMLISFPIAVTDSTPLLETIFFTIFFGALPVAITLAITRYKLFEIDRLISRTISYAIVVAILAGSFFGLIVLVTALLGDQDSLAVAGATLAAAALFNPLRRSVQGFVDKRFNRSTYHAQRVTEEFSAKLLRPHSVEEVAGILSNTVDEVLQPSASAVWVSVFDQESG